MICLWINMHLPWNVAEKREREREREKERERERLEYELFIYLPMHAKPFHIINI